MEDFKYCLSRTDRTNGQTISKDIESLNNITNQFDRFPLENITLSDCRIYIIFKYTWNSHQDSPFAGP